MNAILIASFLLIRCHVADIRNIGIVTDSFGVSGTPGTVTLKVWFKSTIYQCVLYPIAANTEYSCDASEVTIIDSYCDSYDARLLIDNSVSTNAVVIANTFITTTDDVLYGVNGICIDDGSFKGQWYDSVRASDHNCGSGYSHYSSICVDNQVSGGGSCGPGKQLIYFDTTRPNSYITNALWVDGSNVENEITICEANNEVVNIGIQTDIHGVSMTRGTVTLTVWFGSTIYQCVVAPTAKDTQYSCDSSEITVVGSYCEDDPATLLIDNSATTDGVVITNVFINTMDGSLYGVDGICIDDGSFKGEWYSNVQTSDSICGSGASHYSAICVDNEVSGSGSCGAGKQLIYLDPTRPNSYITNALWEDGSDVVIGAVHCETNPATDEGCNECECDCNIAHVSLCMYDNSVNNAVVRNGNKQIAGNLSTVEMHDTRTYDCGNKEQEVFILYAIISGLIIVIMMLIALFAFCIRKISKVMTQNDSEKQSQTDTVIESQPILHFSTNASDTNTL